MANDMVDLLRSCNAWVDPNLIALVPGGLKQGDGESKRKRRKRDKNKRDGPDAVDNNIQNAKKMKKSDSSINNAKKSKKSDIDDMVLDSEDEFPDLAPNRIVLKRASHVSLSDSDDDDES